MILIDLFCGGGGFSLGAHKAGFEVAAAYDLDPILSSSFEANFNRTKLVSADIGLLRASDVRAQVGSRIQGVFGGPPCQGFSDIGRRDVNDPRRHLIGHFFRLIADLEPDFFIMENVKGLAYKDSRVVLDNALGQLGDRYRLMGPLILDAADFGAATKRRRLFVIGTHRDRGDPMSETDLAPFRKPPATVKHAIGDLASARAVQGLDDGFDRWKIGKLGRPSLYAAPLRSPDGVFTGHRFVEHQPDVRARFAAVPQGGMDKVGRHPRLNWNGQCPTLRAGTGADKGSFQAVRPLHPEEPRVITVREAARLQGFPDAHLFHPTIWHSFRMIGNSVSPIIAEAIFKAISAKIEMKRDRRLAA